MTWLLDTNVISESAKRNPSPDVIDWVSSKPVETLFTLSLAFAEIRSGIEAVGDPIYKAALRQWLDLQVKPFFFGRVLETDESFWLAMINILSRAKEKKRTIPATDLIFAVAAERHNLIVVTRNVKHFAGSGIRILNPWLTEPQVVTT